MPPLFRAAGLLVILISGGVGLASFFAGGPAGLARQVPALTPAKQDVAFAALAFFLIALLLLSGALFWACTAARQSISPSRWLPAALIFQLLIGAFYTDLLFVVACEAGYLLAGRSRLWMYGQAAFFLGFVLLTRAASSPQAILELIQIFGWQMFAYAAGHLAGRELQARRSLAFAHAELLATQQVLAGATRMNERLHIARELHDTIGHHLAALSLKLQLAAHHAAGAAAKPIQDAHLIAKLLLSDVRATVSSMREDSAIDLPQALRILCQAIERPTVRFDSCDTTPLRDASHAQVLLRCAQEAITNTVRHSGARTMHIFLRSTPAALELEMHDDGKGAAAIQPGNGLRGMRERLHAAGGSLAIDTSPGKGMRILAAIPHPQELL
ncbi:MAG: sensor histidine kinase [Bryobacterales bacterium]|nr:sensor histidine kinase [Bryobacterales bacterium]